MKEMAPLKRPSVDRLWVPRGSGSVWVHASYKLSLAISVPESDVLVGVFMHGRTCVGPMLMRECVCAVCV